MVNRGPSVGCQTCRTRRIGCDRAKPSCKKCLARGHTCPGYRDSGGVVFKDQSKDVYAKLARRAVSSQSLVLPLPTIPAQLLPDPRDVSTAFFFRQCVLPGRHGWPLGHEYFEHLLPLYNLAPPESALAIAVSAMALRVATAQHVHEQLHLHPLYTQAELTAVRAIKKALSDPRESLRDETLLAVLCLDYAQQLLPPDTARQDSRPHLKGALALVRHRDRASFASPVSQSLYVATRSHVLLHVLWSPNESEDQRLVLTLPEVQSAGEDPAPSLHRILQQVLCLERLMLSRQSHDPSSWTAQDATSARANRAETLCGMLDEWRRGVSWAPAFPLSSASVERAEDASIIQQAFFFGQYLCTFTLALKLLFAETKLAQTITTDDELSKGTKLKAILARVQGLVDSLRYAVIPILERGLRLVRSSLHEIDSNAVVDLVRPELVKGGIDSTAATVSRDHLLCLNTWLWAILTDEMPGAEDFGAHVEGVDDVIASQA